jgi:hypothetical protein
MLATFLQAAMAHPQMYGYSKVRFAPAANARA